MQPIKDLINKIKWDEKENPKDYEIVYIDRILQQEVKIKFKNISKIEEGFMEIDEATIPLHRIVKVYKKGKLIWERKVKKFKIDKKKEEEIRKKLKDKMGWVIGLQ
ncbi:MAG: DUF504 domain-containing protein [Nanoarchaeota archaeon]|nr:DUF504 domain-containing protein [Nanoarchaeota archaeon]MCG2717583.1 DUF504 domain-containing protein [Nanoarchaeota archaeon]